MVSFGLLLACWILATAVVNLRTVSSERAAA